MLDNKRGCHEDGSGSRSHQREKESTTMGMPVHALETPDGRAELQAADIVFGVDVMTGNTFLLFGKDRLDRTVASKNPEPCRMLKVELDQPTMELE
jgi:hypothetical protein